jgi:predicted nucleic acid-binding protein
VTRYLLDTNIISDATKPVPSEALTTWLAGQVDTDLFVSTFTIAEIRRGILQLPDSKKRRMLDRWFASDDGPLGLFAGRILPFDVKASLAWASLMAAGKATGRPRSALDMITAATAMAGNLTVATGNERHFRGVVPFGNPA